MEPFLSDLHPNPGWSQTDKNNNIESSEIVSFENRATFVGVSILQRFQVFLLSHGVYWASVSLN